MDTSSEPYRYRSVYIEEKGEKTDYKRKVTERLIVPHLKTIKGLFFTILDESTESGTLQFILAISLDLLEKQEFSR